MNVATVVDNEAKGRYELLLDGEVVGLADYSVEGDVVVLPHTVIAGRLRGQGLGAVLVQHALDAARAAGRTVVPQCWYVREFIDQHQEYADLVARPAAAS